LGERYVKGREALVTGSNSSSGADVDWLEIELVADIEFGEALDFVFRI